MWTEHPFCAGDTRLAHVWTTRKQIEAAINCLYNVIESEYNVSLMHRTRQHVVIATNRLLVLHVDMCFAGA